MKKNLITILLVQTIGLHGSESELPRTKEELLQFMTAILGGQIAGIIHNRGTFISVKSQQAGSSITSLLLKNFTVSRKAGNTETPVFTIQRIIETTELVSIFDHLQPVTGHFNNSKVPVEITLQDMLNIIDSSSYRLPDNYRNYHKYLLMEHGTIESTPLSSKSNDPYSAVRITTPSL